MRLFSSPRSQGHKASPRGRVGPVGSDPRLPLRFHCLAPIASTDFYCRVTDSSWVKPSAPAPPPSPPPKSWSQIIPIDGVGTHPPPPGHWHTLVRATRSYSYSEVNGRASVFCPTPWHIVICHFLSSFFSLRSSGHDSFYGSSHPPSLLSFLFPPSLLPFFAIFGRRGCFSSIKVSYLYFSLSFLCKSEFLRHST